MQWGDEKLKKEYIARAQENITENLSEFWDYVKSKNRTTTYQFEMQYNVRKCDQLSEIVVIFADYFEGL